MGLAAIAEIGRTALVLVHTMDLLEQWVTRARDVLGITAGVYGGGKRQVRPLTIGLLQTVARLPVSEVRALGAQFGVLVVDEAHHIPCATLSRVMDTLGCRWRWGLSATPQRDDGLSFQLGWALGPILYEIKPAALLAAGHLVPAEIVQVETGWTWDGDPQADYTGLLADLVADPDRNARIVDQVVAELDRGGTVLVLSLRVAHCEALAELIRQRGRSALALVGGGGKKARRAALDALRTSAEMRCVCATQLADEGLDVPRLTLVLLACPGRSQRQMIQRLGRVMRPAPDKPGAMLIDLVDDVPLLRTQAKARLRAYRSVLGELWLQVLAPGQVAGPSRIHARAACRAVQLELA
jgi:superfamily II DNA or RNA helicase